MPTRKKTPTKKKPLKSPLYEEDKCSTEKKKCQFLKEAKDVAYFHCKKFNEALQSDDDRERAMRCAACLAKYKAKTKAKKSKLMSVRGDKITIDMNELKKVLSKHKKITRMLPEQAGQRHRIQLPPACPPFLQETPILPPQAKKGKMVSSLSPGFLEMKRIFPPTQIGVEGRCPKSEEPPERSSPRPGTLKKG